MKGIDGLVHELRSKNRPVLASFAAAWKAGVAFLILIAVAVILRNDPSLIIVGAKAVIAVVALLSWVVDAYFIRKHWELEK